MASRKNFKYFFNPKNFIESYFYVYTVGYIRPLQKLKSKGNSENIEKYNLVCLENPFLLVAVLFPF